MKGCAGGCAGMMLGAALGFSLAMFLIPANETYMRGLEETFFAVLAAIVCGPVGFAVAWVFQARADSKENERLRAELEDLRQSKKPPATQN